MLTEHYVHYEVIPPNSRHSTPYSTHLPMPFYKPPYSAELSYEGLDQKKGNCPMCGGVRCTNCLEKYHVCSELQILVYFS